MEIPELLKYGAFVREPRLLDMKMGNEPAWTPSSPERSGWWGAICCMDVDGGLKHWATRAIVLRSERVSTLRPKPSFRCRSGILDRVRFAGNNQAGPHPPPGLFAFEFSEWLPDTAPWGKGLFMKKLRIHITVTLPAMLATLAVLSVFSPIAGRIAAPLQPVSSIHLTLGNPSKATSSTANPNNFLVINTQYALSYNRDKGGPNWVSWHLESSDLGNSGRCNCFAPDLSLPGNWQIRPNDYQGSGFDRGHLCPSGDRTNTRDNNAATFLMDNMLPQTAALNRHVWVKLETYCRDLAREGDELYIIAGGRGEQDRIANGKVNVPTHCWKIVLALTAGDNDLSRINEHARVIAVDMPNEEGIGSDPWRKYLTTAGDIETKTGHHFFTALPQPVQKALKVKKDSGRRSARPK
jgi:endonuclease G